MRTITPGKQARKDVATDGLNLLFAPWSRARAAHMRPLDRLRIHLDIQLAVLNLQPVPAVQQAVPLAALQSFKTCCSDVAV